jgi:hypothetical protein
MRTVVLASASIWVALQWAPLHVGDGARALDRVEAVLVELRSEEPIGQMIAGAEVVQDVLLAASDDPPPGAVDPRVCVRPHVVTFDRDIVGALDVTLSTQAASRSFRSDAAALGDWSEDRFCLVLPAERPTLEGLRFRFTGADAPLGSEPGRAVSLLHASPQVSVAPAVFTTPERDGRATIKDGPIAMRVTLDYRLPRSLSSAADRTVAVSDATVRWLPRILALMTVALMVLNSVTSRPASRSTSLHTAGRGRRTRGRLAWTAR